MTEKFIPYCLPDITQAEIKEVVNTLESGWLAKGPKTIEFEEKFADYVGSNYAIAVSNCTTALHLSLLVAGVGVGDEVICPSMTFIATSNAVMHAGATPVLAEVGLDYNLNLTHVESLITSKTKAIILVHQIGMPGDIDGFKKLCEEMNIVLIEDAACAIGSEYKGKKIGSHSDLVCFSFSDR